MADFKTHITVSTAVGVAYGYWGVTQQSMPIESSLIAGGLCSVSGILPDLDSDSGIPLRETSMFMAAVVPMLMIERFRDMNLSHESMALAAMMIYIFIRFVVIGFFKRFTVHRGMWHSLPAAAIAGLIAYLAMPCINESCRVYKSLAVVVGCLVHLTLDEIWSFDFKRGHVRIKKSFGTALKFFGDDAISNFAVYAVLALLVYFASGDNGILDRIKERMHSDQTYIARPSDVPTSLGARMPWR